MTTQEQALRDLTLSVAAFLINHFNADDGDGYQAVRLAFFKFHNLAAPLGPSAEVRTAGGRPAEPSPEGDRWQDMAGGIRENERLREALTLAANRFHDLAAGAYRDAGFLQRSAERCRAALAGGSFNNDVPIKDIPDCADRSDATIEAMKMAERAFQKRDDLAIALRALVARSKECHLATQGIFTVAALHGCKYTGPTIVKELEDAERVLASLPKGKGAKMVGPGNHGDDSLPGYEKAARPHAGPAPLDAKFYGTIRKVKDNSVVPADEFVVFLAKDNAFAETLHYYRERCVALGADREQIDAVDRMILRLGAWRLKNPSRLKVPDAHGEKLADQP